MNISSLATTSQIGATSGPARGPRPPGPPPGGGPQAVVAELTGLSTDEIADQLASGSSLADVAESAGVGRDELIAALVEDAPPRLAASGDVESIVSDMVDEAGGPRRPGRPDGPPPPPSGALTGNTTDQQSAVLDAIADLLDTDQESVIDQLSNGADLAEMLDRAGVTQDELAAAIEPGLLFDARV